MHTWRPMAAAAITSVPYPRFVSAVFRGAVQTHSRHPGNMIPRLFADTPPSPPPASGLINLGCTTVHRGGVVVCFALPYWDPGLALYNTLLAGTTASIPNPPKYPTVCIVYGNVCDEGVNAVEPSRPIALVPVMPLFLDDEAVEFPLSRAGIGESLRYLDTYLGTQVWEEALGVGISIPRITRLVLAERPFFLLRLHLKLCCLPGELVHPLSFLFTKSFFFFVYILFVAEPYSFLILLPDDSPKTRIPRILTKFPSSFTHRQRPFFS